MRWRDVLWNTSQRVSEPRSTPASFRPGEPSEVTDIIPLSLAFGLEYLLIMISLDTEHVVIVQDIPRQGV